MLPDPKTVSDGEFRDKLEAIVDLLTCAVNGSTYPPGRDSFDPDVHMPDPIRPVTDFSNSAKQLYILKQDALFTAYADEARHRDFDPAWRRLAKNIDDLVCKLAEKLAPQQQEFSLDALFKPRQP